ncbi:MAG TPA: DUF2142 domain-containing protein [Micromonosporaceae bacterium]
MAQATPTSLGRTGPASVDADEARRRVRRWWWLAFTAFFLLGAAWAVALPANGTYDEKQHIVRAYGVATGHLLPVGHADDTEGKRYEAFEAPRSLLPLGTSVDCTWWKPAKTADCQRWSSDRTPTLLPSAAGRYSPVYYLPVGIPLVIRPDFTGIVLARLVSALMSAMLLASAATAAVRLGNRLVLVAVILVTTPLTMDLAGAVNDNGVEISAGVLVFATLLALVRAPSLTPGNAAPALPDRAVRRLLLLAAIAIALLLTVRHMGPLLLALDVLACLTVARRGRIRALAGRRDARWLIGGATVVGVGFAVGWLWYSRVADIPPDPTRAMHLTLGAELSHIAVHRIPFYIVQMVGQFSYGEITISSYAVAVWYLLVAALVVPGLILARARVRLVAAGLVVICLGILIGLELVFVSRLGWYAHGRYVLPTLVGVPLIAAAASGYRHRLAARGRLRAFATGVAVLVVPLHAYALAAVMTRFQVGSASALDPLAGQWSPPLGPVPPLLADLAGAVLLAVLAWRFADRSSQPLSRAAVRGSTAEAATH